MQATDRMTAEDIELDRRWRERFGEPLPILGASRIVREVLARPVIARPRPKTAGLERRE